MVSFVVYDLALLVISTLAVALFLYRKKQNVKRQGIIFLYKSRMGIKLMDSFARKNQRWLNFVKYLIVASGVLLMISGVWLIAEVTYIYFSTPIAKIIRAPPIAPLIPYFPKIFGLSSVFPPLFFTYFIIAVGIGGVLHEVAHGILAKSAKLRVKSTGFFFIGPLLGAFVEPDEKQMSKASKLSQLGILGAGTFANVIIAFVTAIAMWVFFALAFTPAGIGFTSYPSAIINTSFAQLPNNFSPNETFAEISFNGRTYLANPILLKEAIDKKYETVRVLEDTPAARASLPYAPSVISEIDGKKISSLEELSNAISSHSPGEDIKIVVLRRDGFFDVSGEREEYILKLAEKDGKAFLGIAVEQTKSKLGLSMSQNFNYIFSLFGLVNPLSFFDSNLGNVGWFIYYLLWWVFFINFLLAIFNMLPVGPLDGGRFLQLTAGGILKSDKAGKKIFVLTSWLIIAMIIAMMVKWFTGFFG